MKSREELLRDYERSIFALMMDELGQEEGEEALREWEKLERGEGFQASEESMTRCWQAAEGVYRRERLRRTGQRCVWVLRKAALTAAVCVLCLAAALAVLADFGGIHWGCSYVPLYGMRRGAIFDCGLGTRAQHPNRGGIYWRR